MHKRSLAIWPLWIHKAEEITDLPVSSQQDLWNQEEEKLRNDRARGLESPEDKIHGLLAGYDVKRSVL